MNKIAFLILFIASNSVQLQTSEQQKEPIMYADYPGSVQVYYIDQNGKVTNSSSITPAITALITVEKTDGSQYNPLAN
jgi:hypothetical protein